MRTRFLAALAFAGACRGTSLPLNSGNSASLAGEVQVDRGVATFRFPQLFVRDWSCSYRAGGHPNDRVYSWTINVTGSGSPWYVIDVWPVLPETLAARAPRLATILSFARPEIGIAGGEPPLTLEKLKGTPQVSAEEERPVVRVRGSALVQRLFRSRPDSVRVVACVDGNDQWTRVLPVRYR